MARELAYVLITPYTILKSRTGGVISRLLSRTQQELVGVRMFAPSQNLCQEYADLIRRQDADDVKVKGLDKDKIRNLIAQYVLDNMGPDPETKQRRRVMMLLFEGDHAIQKIRDEVVGHVTATSISGETIRDTYGDFVLDKAGNVRYFEPAVMIIPNSQGAREKLLLWAKYSDQDGGLLQDVIHYPSDVKPETVLVLIKPENFQRPSSRVGNIIDMFSKTGLYIIGAQMIQMSVDQALEFYGPVQKVLREKMKSLVGEHVRQALQSKFDFCIPDAVLNDVTVQLTPLYADNEFSKIIKFMAGQDLAKVGSTDDKKSPGKEKCLALVYQGKDAVNKIRTVLGLTDPNKAAPATVRREYGQNILVNAAHASDSVENAQREMKILGIGRNDVKACIESFFGT